MSFDGIPGRLRQLERALAPSGEVVVVIISSMTPEEIEEREQLIKLALAKRRKVQVVRINVGPAPA